MSSLRTKSKRDQISLALLAVVLLILAGVVVWNFFLSGPAPRPALTAAEEAQRSATRPPAASPGQPRATTPADDLAQLETLIADRSPLDFSPLSRGGAGGEPGTRGNVFAYFVPPPPKPLPPPPPPPITLQIVQPQTAVAGTPRSFTMTVVARDMPADARIFIDGRARETKRVNETTLTTEIKPEEYAGARSARVEVKSAGDPEKSYSNTIPFITSPPPDPQFKYIGRIGDQGLFEMTGTKEVMRLRAGSTIQNTWRIDAISDVGADLTLIQFDIKRRIPMQEKTR